MISKHQLGQDSFLVRYSSLAKEMVESPTYSNSVLGCYVTAYARLRLYNLLEKAGERALYTDTGV